MAHGYLRDSGISKIETPQNQPIPGSNQIQNSAGGYSWKVDKWSQLNRFLILGSEGGTYYIGERKLTQQNALNVIDCLNEDYKRTIDTIIEISDAGRAPKNDPAIYALALAASNDNLDCRSYALANLQKICRIGTHLFHFADYISNQRGWGRQLRRAIGNWYNSKSVDQLSFQLAKYQQRDGWSNCDLLRLSHPTPPNEQYNLLYKWAAGKEDVDIDKLFGLPKTFELLKKCKTEKEVLAVMDNNIIQREIIPTEFLNSKAVWEKLYPQLKLEALVRNLAKLTQIGILDQGKFKAIDEIATKLTNQELIKKSRIHPLQVLMAIGTYSQGHGFRGSLTWRPVPRIIDALNDMFYLSFGNVEPTNKRLYLGIDVSGSMGGSMISGTPLTARDGSGALAMVTMRTEKNYIIKGFSDGGRGAMGYYRGNTSMVDLGITAKMDLNSVIRKISGLPFGATDCALPMLDATQNGYEIDAFVIYTDSETWFGKIHPMQALKEYRKKSGIPAKLIIVGMTSNNFSIADPNDKGCLDVVGFDSSVPNIMSEFILDRI